VSDGRNVDPDSADTSNNLGNLLDDKKDFDGAEDAYKKALAIDPKDAYVWYNLGQLMANNKKDFDGAEAAFKKALTIDPKDVVMWYNFGILLDDNQRPVCSFISSL